jgi:hypothetical protein
MPQTENRNITISEETFNRLDDRLGHTEFDSVEEYVQHVLDELTLYVDDQFDSEDTEEIEEEEVKERLRSLGYLRE